MAVQVEPAAIQVPASGGNVSLQLMNGNPEVRFAFKLKSSNNEHYRVNPVFGFVEPGAAAQVEVIRQNGPPKGDDKLEICFAGAPPDAGTPRLSSLLDLRASSRSTFLWLLHEYGSGTI
uniref:MSP domain-containing protein n=1 Tax=Meloidogyne enterolobii TaxID=390850 RepID=A0A6V7U524_MELEN|nr:unnamed protein product [Meloidogyne enterolobii]